MLLTVCRVMLSENVGKRPKLRIDESILTWISGVMYINLVHCINIFGILASIGTDFLHQSRDDVTDAQYFGHGA